MIEKIPEQDGSQKDVQEDDEQISVTYKVGVLIWSLYVQKSLRNEETILVKNIYLINRMRRIKKYFFSTNN